MKPTETPIADNLRELAQHIHLGTLQAEQLGNLLRYAATDVAALEQQHRKLKTAARRWRFVMRGLQRISLPLVEFAETRDRRPVDG